MADVTYEQTSPVTGRLQLDIPKEEINQALIEALKKERKRTNMRGFRKGKTPLSALRKMMGNQLLGPILERTVQEKLYGYIEENELKLIFSPIPDESEPSEEITATRLRDLKLVYDLGLEPDFEVHIPEQTFTKYVLKVTDDFLDEQVENLRKRSGKSKELEEGTVEEEDIAKVTISEVDGELSNDTSLYIESLQEGFKTQIIGAEVGTSLVVDDLTEVEMYSNAGDDESAADFAKKYLLDLDEGEAADYSLEGKQFSIQITGIQRTELPEFDEEFFIQYDPSGEVTNEEQLRESLGKNNAAGFEAQGIGLLNFEIQRAMTEGHDFELPLELMHRINDEEERSFERFERGVRWMLIRNRIAEKFELELTPSHLRAAARNKLLGMFGGQHPDFLTDDFIDNYVQRLLADEQQRSELQFEAAEDMVMEKLREEVSVEEKALSPDEFNETIKAFNEKHSPEEGEEE